MLHPHHTAAHPSQHKHKSAHDQHGKKGHHSKHVHHAHHARNYDPSVVNEIIASARRRKLSDDHIVTALMVGIQESGLRNLDHGHGTSVGWRQEVHKYYGSVANRMNVPASVDRFYNELTHTPRAATLGLWGQAVQRSAYPNAYDRHLQEARRILAEHDKK